MRKKISLLLIMIILLFSIVSCNNRKDFADDGRHKVLATTTLVGDLAKVIGGECVDVVALMGPGIDPHGYNASAGDIELMYKAEMVIYNGLHLEGKMVDVFEKINKRDKIVFALADGISEDKLIKSTEGGESYDPHIWFDVDLWQDAAKEVAGQLKVFDSENSEVYDNNLEAYLQELDDLDSYIRSRIDELPKKSRLLITAHDAFAYLGAAYGIEVRGLQGISTSTEAGTLDVSEIANLIVDREIKAIFIESSVPRKGVEALQEAVLAKGFEVEIGGELYSDSTGNIGTDAETYIGTFKANIDTIVDSLK